MTAALGLAGCAREPAAAPAPPPPPEPEKVTFHRVSPAVGARADVELTVQLDVSVTIDGRLFDVVGRSKERLVDEVLEVTDGAVTKARLDCLESSSWVSAAGQSAQDEPTAIHGKSYLLEAKGGGTRVSTPQGKAVSAAESKLVTMHSPSLDNLNTFLAALPSEPVPVGATLPAVAAVLAKELAWATAGDMASEAQVESVVLMGTREGRAVLEVAGRLVLDDGTMRLEVPLRGPLEVDLATGAPMGVRLEGPVTGESSPRAPKPLPISAKGKLKLRSIIRAS